MKNKKFTFLLAFLLAITTGLGSISEYKAQERTDISTQNKKTSPVVDTYTDKWSIIPSNKQVPDVDGELDDPVWEGASTLHDFVTAYYNKPAESDTDVKLSYDEQNLYIGVDHKSNNDSASLANVEIILSPNPEGDQYFRVPVKIKNLDTPYVNDWGPNIKSAGNVKYETKKKDGGVTAEIVVPLASVGVDKVKPGDEWRFNAIMQHELGTRPLSSWVPIRTSFYDDTGVNNISVKAKVTDEARMGSIFFQELPEHLVPDNDTDIKEVTPWEPKQLTFSYTSFTDKELSFKRYSIDPQKANFTLKWKSPSGTWTDIKQIQPKKVGKLFNISFKHPDPTENGTYQLLVTVSQDHKSEAKSAILTFDRHGLIKAGDILFSDKGSSDENKTPVTPAPPSKEVEKVMEIIPENAGFIFSGMPDKPHLSPSGGNFEWSPDDPWILTSKHSDLTYPNDQYPENQVLTVKNRKGEVVEYPYYEDESGKQYFLSAHIWYKQKDYALREMASIANKDPLGAARLLYRFAEVYEGYVSTNDYLWHQYPVDPASGPPYAYWGGTWYRWSVAELINFSYLAKTYGKLKETNAFEVLSEEIDDDVERRIVDDMLKPSVEFLRTFAIINTNMDYYNWLGLIDMGEALDDPSYIHDAVERLEDYALSTYLFDGFFKETTLSYHNQSTNGINRAIESLMGWSDPEGYVSPRSGTRLENLNMREKFPALKKSAEIPNLIVYPNGKYFPTQGTWASEKSAKPLFDARSFLLPASGITRLARGTGESKENGQLAITYDFPALDIAEQTAGHKLFSDSGTVQLEANGVGDSISFIFDVPKTDTYEIDLKPFRAGSYGQYDVKIDSNTISNINFYATPGGPRDFETIGKIELTKGTHHITFESIGKVEESTNYKMGVIQMALWDAEAQKKRDEAEQGDPKEEGDPTQLYLTFQPKYGHNHWDPLNLALYDEGQELLPDIGYTHTFYRKWTESTLAHNTVVVDSEDMSGAGEARHGGNIDVFATLNNNVQVTRASQETAYTQTDEYSREPWLIQFPDAENNEGYVLDLFRVSGGDRHEYTLQGDANNDGSFETDISLSDYGPYLLPEGVEVRQPETERDKGSAEGHYYGYIYVRDVKKADIADGKYDMTLVTEKDGQEKAKMKITGLVEPGQNELFLGESPSLRATRLHGTAMDNNDEAVKYMMPKMVVRREGNDLTSHFITAMEPYSNGADPRIENIEKLTPDQMLEGDIAVKVTYGDTTDIVLSSLDPDQPLTIGDITFKGKMGMIRLKNGKVQAMHLIGGTLLKKGDVEVTDEGPVAAGTVTDVLRQAAGDGQNAFITDIEVPVGLKGHTLVITHPDGKTHGYEIEEVTEANGQTVIDIADMDPGFSINDNGTSELKFYPFTEWRGATTFRIENVVQK